MEYVRQCEILVRGNCSLISNKFFNVLLTVNIGIILFNDQLDAQFFFVYVYFNFLHVSSIQVLIIRRFNCINTISGICHSM